MATYQDVLLSILSMDTYNRGYGTGMADGINLDAGADFEPAIFRFWACMAAIALVS